MWYWIFKYLVIGPVIGILGRPTVSGLENFPKTGGAVVASNHLAVVDSFFLPLKVPRRIIFLAKQEYYTGTGVVGIFHRWFFSAAGQVPIDRTSASTAQNALETGLRIVRNGGLLCMYIEGTRSPDGKLYRGKTGVARLAIRAGVPIIPVAMVGTREFNPPGTTIPRARKVAVHIGEPIETTQYADRIGDRDVEREVTDEVMRRLQKLSGQEYVDAYAADVKKILEAGDGE